MPASEERSISEFPTALNILATTLLFVSTYDSGNDSYDSEKVSAVDLASAILGDFEFTQDLATNVKTIFGAINSIMVLSGTTVPSSAIGANGQLYFKYTSSGGTDTVDAMYLKINNAWCEVATGGGGGGASVTLGTTVPSDASGSNGDLYVQYDGTSYAVVEYYVKINNAWRRTPFSRVVALTQAQYDLITPDNQTLYVITDAQGSYVKLPVISDAYDSTATSNTGDYCIYNDVLYKCNTDNTTGTWDAQYWDATSVAEELQSFEPVKDLVRYSSYNAMCYGTLNSVETAVGNVAITNGVGRNVGSWTTESMNYFTLPDDNLYLINARIKTSDGSGLLAVNILKDGVVQSSRVFNKISGQPDSNYEYTFFIAGSKNAKISASFYNQGASTITSTISLVAVRMNLQNRE